MRRKEQYRVKYDVNYTGGDYSGIGQFVIVTIERFKTTVAEAFREKTGLDPRYIVHHEQVEIEIDTIDNLKLMERACQPKKKQLLTYHDAVTVKKQHVKACSDCPFARTAVPGGLADMDPGTWMKIAHGDGLLECHTRKSPEDEAHQCAGGAVFRANVCKVPRNKELLRLPRDPTLVFADNDEFLKHHHEDGYEP